MGSLSEAFKRELDGVMSRLKNVTERREKTINEKKQYLARIENIKKKGRLNFGEYFDSSKLSVGRSTEKNGLSFESKSVRKIRENNALRPTKRVESFTIKGVDSAEIEYVKALKDNETFLKNKEQEWLRKQQEKQKKEDKENKKKLFSFIENIGDERYSNFLESKNDYLNNDNMGYESVVNTFINKQLRKDSDDFKQKKIELEGQLKKKEEELNKLKNEIASQKQQDSRKEFDNRSKILSEKNKELMNKLKAKKATINKYRQYYKQEQKKLNEMQKDIINMKYKNSGKHKFK